MAINFGVQKPKNPKELDANAVYHVHKSAWEVCRANGKRVPGLTTPVRPGCYDAPFPSTVLWLHRLIILAPNYIVSIRLYIRRWTYCPVPSILTFIAQYELVKFINKLFSITHRYTDPTNIITLNNL